MPLVPVSARAKAGHVAIGCNDHDLHGWSSQSSRRARLGGAGVDQLDSVKKPDLPRLRRGNQSADPIPGFPTTRNCLLDSHGWEKTTTGKGAPAGAAVLIPMADFAGASRSIWIDPSMLPAGGDT